MNEILASAASPLKVGEIHELLQRQLGQEVSRDTVTSFLSLACRAPDSPIQRVGHGCYVVVGG